ncbi:transglycosylase domain-containing protein [Niveispirillum sp. KHB5.9]|uniref:transglycosylase domain-containing protein n=1 Tax=Niveispirillum sp. KHB5.9 TaxID=3400269 RepID=UPI003A8C256F
MSTLNAPPRFRPAAPPAKRGPSGSPPGGNGGGGTGGGPPREPENGKAPRKAKGPRKTWGKRILSGLIATGIWCVIVAAGVVAYVAHDMPSISEVATASRRPAITLVALDGTEFQRLGDLRGETLDASELPKHFIQALVATEDRRFFRHFGVDPMGILRAAYANHQAGRTVQGGSTLTQQLAKNLFLTPDQNFKRKAQEALLAVQLEATYSKEQILTAYLNRVYLGAGTFGVDAAARTYFNKSARNLTLRESAIIVGLLKAPSRYAPTASLNRATQRMGVVLRAMLDEGYITPAQYDAAMAAPPAPARKQDDDGDGRYFAGWVADQLPAFVGADHGDLIVYTTFDPGLQRLAEQKVVEMLKGPGADAKVSQAAALVMTPDGAIRSMIGGKDYSSSEFNRATQAMRQPGSAFKPVVYLAALEEGWSEYSTVLDAPYRKAKWNPGNYDGRFRGDVSLRDALAHSLNTATIRLAETVGIDNVRHAAKRLGLTTPMRRDLSLALGTSEVTLLDLTGAYATLANGGEAVIPYGILEIRDTGGGILYQRQGSSAGFAVAAPHVEAMNRLLSGPVTYGTGKAAMLDRPTVGKTGTTQDYKDAWFMGYTADLVGGVWLGNDDGTPMKKVTGGGLPAKLWHAIMMDAHQGLPARGLPGLGGAPSVAAVEEAATMTPEPVSELPADGTILQTAEGAPPSEPPPAQEGGDPIGDLLRRLTGR